MKSLIVCCRLTALCAAAWILWFAGCCSERDCELQQDIHGAVVDADSQAPIAGARVHLLGGSCLTDYPAVGTYACDVGPGAHRVSFSAEGYEPLDLTIYVHAIDEDCSCQDVEPVRVDVALYCIEPPCTGGGGTGGVGGAGGAGGGGGAGAAGGAGGAAGAGGAGGG